MQNAVIIDLDGTLCDNEHRKHFIDGEKKDWQSFNSAKEVAKDSVHKWCAFLIEKLKSGSSTRGVCIIFLTGRMMTEETRKETLLWLRESVGHIGGEFWGRPDGNYEKDTDFKRKVYLEKIKPNYNVLFCVDDRQSVVDMWREEGLVCLQCAVGDF